MTGKDLREQVGDFQSTLKKIRGSLREQGRLAHKEAQLINSISGKCDDLLLIIPVKKEDYETMKSGVLD